MPLPMHISPSEQVLALATRQGVLRPVDLAPLGIQAEVLRRLLARGLIKKIGRGRYVPAGTRMDPQLVWAGVARAIPNGVICLRSALTIHKVMAMPLEPVDLAIERRAAKPRKAKPAPRPPADSPFAALSQLKPARPAPRRKSRAPKRKAEKS